MRRAITIVAALLAVAFLALIAGGCGYSDVPDVIPEGHHARYGDYKWKVVIDPRDENWIFYTDTEPAFSIQTTNEGDAQTVVCMKNVRERVRRGQDEYYIGDVPRCVGGEGKVDIDPQGWQVKY